MAMQRDLSPGSENQLTYNPFVSTVLLFFGALGLLTAGAIITGWLPLGERANILRSNINWIEYTTIILSIIYGIACLRSWRGMISREPASQSWARWMTFISIFIGLLLTLSVIIPTIIKLFLLWTGQQRGVPDGSAAAFLLLGSGLAIFGLIGYVVSRRNLPHLIGLFLILLIISFAWPASLKVVLYANLIIATAILFYFFSGRSTGRDLPFDLETLQRPSFFLYIIGVLVFVTQALIWVDKFPAEFPNIRHPEPERLIPGLLLLVLGVVAYRVMGELPETSDELRRAVGLSPGKYIRVMLAKSPSAGSIIGFLTIFLAFTMATDLFLRQSSIAGVLTNVSSKGVIAIGVTILMISGEFDLSVGSILGVGAMTFMIFMTEGIPGLQETPNTAMGHLLDSIGLIGPLSPLISAILAILLTGMLGLINGLLKVVTGIPSFIVTLGTMLAFRAITLVVIAGGRILRYRDYYTEFPSVSIPGWLFIVLPIVGLLILAYSAYLIVPSLWRRFQHNWAVRNSNGDFGTTTAIWSAVVALFITVILIVLGIWLARVALYHLDGGQSVTVGFFDITNGRWDGSMLLGKEGWTIGGRSFFTFDVARDANFRMAIVWWLVFVIAFHIILTNTSYGNAVFATGGNPGAARAQGVNVDRIKVYNFILTAMLTGVAAVYETARNPGVDPLKGDGWELEVIAMTVIGGALLSGGYGSIIGSLLGALIIGMLQTGLVLVGIDARLFTGTVGVVIIVAVVLNTTVRGRSTT
jgi:ribose/xylose/arabinose/galactoside ABC-type transport system permease subunit